MLISFINFNDKPFFGLSIRISCIYIVLIFSLKFVKNYIETFFVECQKRTEKYIQSKLSLLLWTKESCNGVKPRGRRQKKEIALV